MLASLWRLGIVVMFGAALTVVRCIPAVQSSGGTGDEQVIGRILSPDGSPAGNTEIQLLPYDHNPGSGQSPSVRVADTTDADGRYAVRLDSSSIALFTLQAISLTSRKRTIIPDIDISAPGESTLVATASLHETGSIKVVRSDSTISGNGYIFIPGTTYSGKMENGIAIIDSVPAELISTVYYHENSAAEQPKRQAESVMVRPGLTTLVAFSGATHALKVRLNTTPSGADVTEDVLNFPVLVRLTNDNFTFSEARTDGSDLRFTGADDTPLPFEIERWDAAARLAEIWVKVDTVYGNDDGRFFVMYWGEAATILPLNADRVFDTAGGFRGVLHLAEEAAGVGSRGVFGDATGLTRGDDFVSATDRSGIIGCGHAFDGVDDYIPLNSPVTDFVKGDMTIALWVSIGDSGGAILSKLDTTPKWNLGETSFYFGDGTDSNTAPGVNGNRPSFVGFHNDYAIAGEPVAPNGWHHLAFTRRWNGDSTGVSRYFIDGNEVLLSRDSLAVRSGEIAGATLRIGQPNNNESYAYFKGLMDELQISAVARSDGWVRLSYMNQKKDNVLVRFETGD